MDRLSYYLIRVLMAPFAIMPFRLIHLIGRGLGLLAYYLLPRFRKRALSNLALATDLNLSNDRIVACAKGSFQSLCITLLEYPRFATCRRIDRVVRCVNPELAQKLISNGIIFFCAHQANWEVLFLDGTTRMPGVAIARPTKNRYLHNWVIAMREKFGGTIIPQKQAIKGSLRALKAGKFLGIVGDQGLPESDFSSDFLGRRAWTSPVPAMLAYKTGCPIMFAKTKRRPGGYLIHYSDPMYADTSRPLEEEVPRLMEGMLSLLEASIKERPHEWLWIHNRWKQETPVNVYYRFRQDAILIITPGNIDLSILRTIYPKAFLTIISPSPIDIDAEVIVSKDILLDDYRFKLVIDLTETPACKKHYLSLAALDVITPTDMKKIAAEHLSGDEDIPELLLKTLTRPNTLWRKDAG